MKNEFKLIIFGLLIVVVLSGCQGAPERNEELTVYTSIYPLYEVANRVAGDKLNVKLVVPNGAELHSYRPTPKQIANLEDADLFFYNGLGLEPWAKKVENNLKQSKEKIINISQHVNLIEYKKHQTITKETATTDHSNEHEEHKHEEHKHEEHKHEEHKHEEHKHEHNHSSKYDPHLWLDPVNMKLIAEKMKEEFVSLDPANKENYRKNYQKFAEKITQLDKKYQSSLANKQQNHILVSHSAFGYLGRRYDFKQLSVTGVAPHEEPSPGVLAKLTTQAKEHNLDYIFMETLASPKTVNVLAEEANLQVLELNPVAGLTKDEKESGDNYFTLMYQNLDNLKKALVK